MSPLPTLTRLTAVQPSQVQPGVGGNGGREGKGLDGKLAREVRGTPKESCEFSVTVSRGDPRRIFFRKFLAARLKAHVPDDRYEKWILAFPSAQEGHEWLRRNREGIGGPPLFGSPNRDFAEGNRRVKNLVTTGFVDPETLFYHLQADWVDVVGRFGEEFEYRFSSPGTM